MNTVEAKRVIETALLCSGEPLSVTHLRRLFDEEIGADTVRGLLEDLRTDWSDRGLELVALASGIPLWSTLCKLQVQLVNFLPPGPAHDHENLPMNLPPAGTGRRRAYAVARRCRWVYLYTSGSCDVL